MSSTSIIVEVEENEKSFERRICYCFQYCEGLSKKAEILFFFFFFEQNTDIFLPLILMKNFHHIDASRDGFR